MAEEARRRNNGEAVRDITADDIASSYTLDAYGYRVEDTKGNVHKNVV